MIRVDSVVSDATEEGVVKRLGLGVPKPPELGANLKEFSKKLLSFHASCSVW